MDWDILGIEPVKDKKAITAAYRQRLMVTNPEDKPEAFKALRAAYEEALQWAETPEEPVARDTSPVGLWMEQVRALYQDYPARIRTEPWRELLADQVCVALDQRPKAEEALLNFLMEDYFIPQAVWQVLDETFSLTARREELYERWPRDFVDHAVLNGIRFPASLPYELFQPGTNGKDCDKYRHLYFQASHAEPEDLGEIIDKMEALSEWHPYGQGLRLRWQWDHGERETAAEGSQKLAEAYPDDPALTIAWTSLCIQRKDFAAGEALMRRLVARIPDHWQAQRMLAECLAGQEKYEDAKDIIYELMRAAGGDQMQVHQLSDAIQGWNEVLIEAGEARLRDHPEDNDNAMKLAWSYLQNDRMDDALRAAEAMDLASSDPYDYHNLHGKLRYSRKEYAEALPLLQELEAVIRAIVPDGTEKTAKRLRRLPEVLQLEGSCLMQLGDPAPAKEKYRQALEIAPEEPEILTHTIQLLYTEGDYEEALPLLDRLLRVMPGAYHAYLLQSMVLCELDRDKEAFDAVNRALELEGGDLNAYTQKMHILIRNGVWEEVRAILDFLVQNDVGDELSVAFCRAQLIEGGDQDEATALEAYQALAKRVENGEHLSHAANLYYRIAYLLGGKSSLEDPAQREDILTLLDKGLSHNPRDMRCLDFKAWLLKQAKRNQEAIELYHKLEAMPRHPLSIEHNLAELYYRDLAKHARQALHYYQYVLDRNEHPDFHFFAGTCQRYLGNYPAAEQHFLREQALNPGDMDGYNGLAYVYEGMGRYEDALDQINKALAMVIDRDRDYAWLYGHKTQILRRLDRPTEALHATNEAMALYNFPGGYKLRFDTCCQFGLWEEAREMLGAWATKMGETSEVIAASIRLDLLTGQLSRASRTLNQKADALSFADLDDLRLQIAELVTELRTPVDIWRRRAEAGGKDPSHALMNLAEALWWSGRREEAREAAQQALDILDEKLTETMNNQVLFRGRRALVLAILGREDEARAELALVRTLPLCESCDYRSCKDADAFEAFIEEVLGNRDRALALHQQGQVNWPDEFDFLSGLARLNRKG